MHNSLQASTRTPASEPAASTCCPQFSAAIISCDVGVMATALKQLHINWKKINQLVLFVLKIKHGITSAKASTTALAAVAMCIFKDCVIRCAAVVSYLKTLLRRPSIMYKNLFHTRVRAMVEFAVVRLYHYTVTHALTWATLTSETDARELCHRYRDFLVTSSVFIWRWHGREGKKMGWTKSHLSINGMWREAMVSYMLWF